VAVLLLRLLLVSGETVPEVVGEEVEEG